MLQPAPGRKRKSQELELFCEVYIPLAPSVYTYGVPEGAKVERGSVVWVQFATRKNPMFDVSRMEIDRGGITYTSDTLQEMEQKVPKGTELFFITGADAIISVLKWKNSDLIIKLAHLHYSAERARRKSYNLLQTSLLRT